MERLLQFIGHAKQAINKLGTYKTISLVLGNESCDLDSTVSALALAFLLHSQNAGDNNSSMVVIPVMNVDAKLFPLRTESCYLLKKCGIEPGDLVFRDGIDYKNILKSSTVKTTLVDHHVLAEHDKILKESVVQIFDHRPINNVEICENPGMRQTITLVGSCSTLIANEILNSNLPILINELCFLLYATIIYDTIGLDREFGRTFDEDVTVAERLEKILKPAQSRKELFDVLWKKHNDTSSLTTKDLLYRDLKIVKGIPIPGLPLLVEDYLKREDAHAAIESFAAEFNAKNVVLIGIDAAKDVKRDVAIYFTDINFKNTLISLLTNSKETAGSDLQLTEISIKNENVVCFRQGNIKLTRKFILPLVNDAAVQFFNKT